MKCVYFPICNACDYIELDYYNTLNIKLNEFKNICIINNCFPDNFDKLNIIPSYKPYNYRNRAQVHIKDGKIGFHKRKTNKIVEIKECLLLDKKLNDKIKQLNYPKNFTGTLELYLNNNTVYERLVEKKYDNLFSQVNIEVNNILIKEVIKCLELNKNDKVLELYCGNGNFTFEIAKYCKVDGIDLRVPNKKYFNINFIEADINKNLDLINRQNYNKLLLDPPRKGITFEKISILNNFKTIVYVSCKQNTLINDASNLIKLNYSWYRSILLDMFPFTEHLESINIFTK